MVGTLKSVGWWFDKYLLNFQNKIWCEYNFISGQEEREKGEKDEQGKGVEEETEERKERKERQREQKQKQEVEQLLWALKRGNKKKILSSL